MFLRRLQKLYPTMSSYLPLRRHESDERDPEESVKDPLLPEGSPVTKPDVLRSSSRTWADWAVLVLSFLVLVCACTLYIRATSLASPRDVRGLRTPNQYPGIEQLDELSKKRKGPLMIFPNVIVRANRAMPDQVYEKGSHVVLSDNDSMFYQWYMGASPFTSCYIDAVVPTPEEGLAANKTYTASGPLTAIQVWNVSTPAERISSLSWNSRPQRLGLLGTVAFLPDEERKKQLGLEDGWQLKAPTPRFSCGHKATYTIEVACEGCRLEFEQIFSSLPLAFDLLQLG